LRRPLLTTCLALLAGCTGMPLGGVHVAPGTPRDAVLAQLGAPQGDLRMANGSERLQYTQQPLGREAWMVDLDPAGRVVAVQQTLDPAHFNRIVPGQWTVADIQREFGPPARVDSVASWNGPIWTYRWRDIQNADMFYWVYFDAAGVVRRSHPGMEFRSRPFPDF
jgi:hypothetical protein